MTVLKLLQKNLRETLITMQVIKSLYSTTALRKILKTESRWVSFKENESQSQREIYFLRDWGHLAEAEKKNMTDSTVTGHSASHPASIFLKGDHQNGTSSCWLAHHWRVTGWYFSNATFPLFLPLVFMVHILCYSCFLHLVTGDITLRWLRLYHPACSSLDTLTEYVSNDAVWRDW